jgi:signal transduction histidine kinase/ActR/RegA family two-component response regulator
MLPVMWAGRDAREIVGSLLDVLVSILDVDLAYCAFHPRRDDPALEDRRPHDLLPAPDIGGALGITAGGEPPAVTRLPQPGGPGKEIRTAWSRIGVGTAGIVAVAAGRDGFPTRLEKFLLDSAVNQAAVALETAQLVSDLRERDRLKDEQAEILAMVNRVATTLSAELDSRKLVQALTDAAAQITRAAFGAFFSNVVGDRGESAMLHALSGVPPEAFTAVPVPSNTERLGPTFRGEGIVRSADVTADPRFGKNPPRFGLPVRSYLAVPVLARSGEVLGGLVLGHPDPGVFTERDEQLLRGLAVQVGIALDNARLYERELEARAEAERSEQHARFLAEASSLLASSLDVDTILGRVARLAVPTLADLCAVDLLEKDGTIRRVAVAHVDPAKEEAARLLRERYPFDIGGAHGVPATIRSGVSEFLPEITDDFLQQRAMDVEQLELFRAVGIGSAMVVPLVARGRMLGAITLVAGPGGRRYTPVDLALAEDIGRRTGLAVDNARLYREAESARADAEAANRAKDEFLATLSHELRTPLNAILGWARILRAGPLDARMLERALEVMERNADAQAQLIEDLLDMARITTGKLRLDVRPIHLQAVVGAAVDALRPAAGAKRISLETVLDPRAGPIAGDAGRVQQIVWNLVSNAVKFTPHEGRVQIRLERVGSYAAIVVSDTGKGIDADLLPYVFDRFRQADSSSTRAHGGLGIGLALVKHLVELHGGAVAAESAGKDRGATFTVRLPLMIRPEPSRARAHPTWPSPPVGEGTVSLGGVKVVVVDDDADALDLFDTVLTEAGADVRKATSAAEALAVLQSWPANVLISDIEMQDEDGYGLIRRVRQLPASRGGLVSAAAVTAYGRVEDRLRALAAGFQMHVPKPVEPRELVAVVANLSKLTWTPAAP